jgi:hypothetical protein
LTNIGLRNILFHRRKLSNGGKMKKAGFALMGFVVLAGLLAACTNEPSEEGGTLTITGIDSALEGLSVNITGLASAAAWNDTPPTSTPILHGPSPEPKVTGGTLSAKVYKGMSDAGYTGNDLVFVQFNISGKTPRYFKIQFSGGNGSAVYSDGKGSAGEL